MFSFSRRIVCESVVQLLLIKDYVFDILFELTKSHFGYYGCFGEHDSLGQHQRLCNVYVYLGHLLSYVMSTSMSFFTSALSILGISSG